MAGFFPINPGGGAGGQNPATAFVGAQLQGNTIVFSRENGGVHVVDLATIVPNALNDVVKKVSLVGKDLEVEYVNGTKESFSLSKVLDAVDINFTPTGNLVSINVQDAIAEISGKVSGAYVNSDFDSQTGILTLIKEDGTRDERNLGMHVDDARLDVVTNKIHLIKTDGTEVEVDLTPLLVAEKITYTDNTNLGATTVQQAIEKLDGTTITNATYDKDAQACLLYTSPSPRD